MPIQTKLNLITKLTDATKRIKQVREAAERERLSAGVFETEARQITQTPLQTGAPLQGKVQR